MATETISIDDALLARIRQADKGNLSEWISAACQAKLLTDAANATREWERTHPDEAAAARAEDAVHVLEGEAEREIVEHAEHAARTRPDGTKPTTTDYLAAYRHVRDLLERGEQQLREQLGAEQ